jgi:hypothetical protein
MTVNAGVSDSRVLWIWCSSGLKPRRLESFKLPNAPQFSETLEVVVGLYLSSLECEDLDRWIDRDTQLPVRRSGPRPVALFTMNRLCSSAV